MMRYRFVDDVLKLELGEAPRIEVSKTFALGDDALSGPAGRERVPNSLLLELLAMTGGHLIFRHGGRARLPLLLKVEECRFEGGVRAGVRLTAVAELRGASGLTERTGMAETAAEAFQDGRRVAHGRLLYVCIAVPPAAVTAFEDRL